MKNLTEVQIENRKFLGLDNFFSYNENCKEVTDLFIAQIAEKLNLEFNTFASVRHVAKIFKTTFIDALLNLNFFETDFVNNFEDETGFRIEKTQNKEIYYLRNE